MRRGVTAAVVCLLLLSTLPARATHGMGEVARVRISKQGLGRIEVRRDLAAVLQRDEGIVALVGVGGAKPKVLGRYDDGAAQSLDGDLAFSKDGRFVVYARQTVQFSRDGIHVIDVTDPKNPALRSYSPGGGAYRVLTHSDASGEYVVLLDAVLGLVVYRMVEGVLIPVHVDALPALKVGGPASAGMTIRNGLLYVTTGETGLQVYDFTDPLQPRLLGAWGDQGLAEVEVAKVDGRLLAFGATEYWFQPQTKNEILVLDVSDPAAIEEVDRWRFAVRPSDDSRIQGMVFSDGILYAAHSWAGLVGFRDGKAVERLGGTTCYHVPPHLDCPAVYDAPHAFDVETHGNRFLVTDYKSGDLLVATR